MKHLMRYEGYTVQQRVDDILDKISKYGMSSLRPDELDFLNAHKTGTEEERAAKADGTLETIPDYYLYGYAGCIPDLSMEKAKPIQTRVVGSDKQEGQTREQFIASLPEGQDVDEALANYEGEFIEINLNFLFRFFF